MNRSGTTEAAGFRYSAMNRRQFNKRLGATGLAILTLGLSRAARAATTINWVGWQDYDKPLAANNFLEANSVTLQTTYISAVEEITTKLRGGGMGSIDLATPEVGSVELMVKQGLLEPIDMSRVPDYSKLMPFFSSQPMLQSDGKQYAIPFTWGTEPMLYRPDLVSEPPTSWLDVMKPEYKGKVVMVGGMQGNVKVWGRVVTGTQTPTRMTPAQLKQTIDFLIKIKKEQARVYATSFGEMADIMARGDAVISTLGWEPVVQWVKAKGATLGMVYPKEGTTGFMDLYVICKNAPNIELDHHLINNVISTQAQLELAAKLGQGIVNQEAIQKLPASEHAAYPYDHMETLSQRASFYPLPPLEDDGVHATYKMYLTEWERFKRA